MNKNNIQTYIPHAKNGYNLFSGTQNSTVMSVTYVKL